MPSFFADRPLWEALAILAFTALVMGGVASLAFRTSARLLAVCAFALALVQGFVPYSYTSWFLLFVLSISPAVLWRSRADKGSRWYLGALVALGVAQVVALLWSPVAGAAINAIACTISVLTTFLLWRLVAAERAVEFVLKWNAPIALAFAVLVVFFRMVPDREWEYLHLPIARFFTDPGVELIPTGRYPNVIDPAKAGGIALNGNIASLVLVLLVIVYLIAALGPVTPRIRALFAATAAVAAVGVACTGSKTPLLLVVVLPVVALVALLLVRSPMMGTALGVVVAIVGSVAAWLVARYLPVLWVQLTDTYSQRIDYWRLALSQFPMSWTGGLGYGGWEPLLLMHWKEMYGDAPFQGYAVHNFVIQAWVDGGIAVVTTTVAIVAIALTASLQRIYRERELALLDRRTMSSALALVGVVWVTVHGMGDTTSFYGDYRTIVLYSFLVAYVTARPNDVDVALEAAPSEQAIVAR